MIEKYQTEIDDFERRFSDFKDKKIVLYGIGRYTVTLLEGVQGFSFVGLLDREPGNIGKEIMGVPVIDIATAEANADIIIINTSEGYWNVIYQRIKNLKVPIYFKNGVLAQQQIHKVHDNMFVKLSKEELINKIYESKIVSFDFFDTLFMRKVANPNDVFCLLDYEIDIALKEKKSFVEIRNLAKNNLGNNYSLNELYEEIKILFPGRNDFWNQLKKRELEFELELLVPRIEILEILQQILNTDKKIYIISDMYLPHEFYTVALEKYGILNWRINILVSNELKCCKADETMWQYYSTVIDDNKLALHIGDNRILDIDLPKKYGLNVYMTPNSWDVLMKSSISEIGVRMCSCYASLVVGLLLKEKFNSPYILSKTNEVIQITSNEEMGYFVFGPVMLSFLLWLEQKNKSDGNKRLIFMSRDGFFLKDLFDYFSELKGIKQDSSYLVISRQLAMTAAIDSEEAFWNYISMPYSGSVTEMLEDRLELKGVAELENAILEDYVEAYKDDIRHYIERNRQNYLKYLSNMQLDDTCAVIDVGFYGNNQYYLNHLLGLNMRGYYFTANLSSQNPNTIFQKMAACFQTNKDLTGENSQVRKNIICLEGYLTAPYGMVRAIDENQDFIYARKGKNQEHFADKEAIHQGVKKFIKEYLDIFGRYNVEPDLEFIDWMYGYMLCGNLEFSEDIKQSFYNDNAFMNRIESSLFF